MASRASGGREPADVTITTHEPTVDQRLLRVDALDLEPIVFKLTHPEPGEARIALPRADHDVWLYRCFLKLCVLYPGSAIVPTRQVDHVWHTHMLDTAMYRADCDQVFGHFLDHFPYAGLRGEDDWHAWRQSFAATRRLFRVHFGAEIGIQAAASACRAHVDGADCLVGCITPTTSSLRPRPERSRQAGG
jgi:hypothetical protein